MDHWHPILPSQKLGRQPRGVRINGHDIVLFRTEAGGVGALTDECPHRRMRLSTGAVMGDKLQCPYHGWRFDCAGHGESPGTPKLHARACHYDTVENNGVIWVKSAASAPVMPTFDVGGWYHLCTLHHTVRAPLEVTVDNFCEIEHTPTTHAFFGYDLAHMHEVKVDITATATTTRVVNLGPPKPVPWFYRQLLGIGKNYQFHDDWTTHFSPVYSIYDHSWVDPATGQEGMVRWRIYIFFVPIDEQHTSLMSFTYVKSRYPGPAGGVRLFAWRMRRMIEHEIELDLRILENLADQSPHLEGMKLSRFDRILGLNRERIAGVYRGEAGAASALRVAA